VSLIFRNESVKCDAFFIRIYQGRINDRSRRFFVGILDVGHGGSRCSKSLVGNRRKSLEEKSSGVKHV
jgi:hypothetical protein